MELIDGKKVLITLSDGRKIIAYVYKPGSCFVTLDKEGCFDETFKYSDPILVEDVK